MPSVITEKCLGETYAACVDACPVACIHPGQYKGESFMVINPEECTECGSCVSACPIGAIVDNVDADPAFAKINAELAPTFKNNPPVTARPTNDPPRKPGNKLVN
jgi:NAD-dependent dihydropyrimidine dehydrogenase PreA subunit